VVLLGCHCIAGDGGGEGGASNLGAPLRMPRMTLLRVRRGTPQLFGPPILREDEGDIAWSGEDKIWGRRREGLGAVRDRNEPHGLLMYNGGRGWLQAITPAWTATRPCTTRRVPASPGKSGTPLTFLDQR
jgi:hypothetical protein